MNVCLDRQSLEMLLGLVCRLVHLRGSASSTSLMSQFCDAVGVLESGPALRRLLSVDKRKARVVAHVLAVASHVLRTRPEHVAVVDDMLRPDVDLLRLLKHRNPLITARCCTLIAHLTHRSASDADVCAKSLAIQRCRIDSK